MRSAKRDKEGIFMRELRVLLADTQYAMLDYLAIYLARRLDYARILLESSGQLLRAIGACMPDIVVAGGGQEQSLRLWNRLRQISPRTCPKLILLAPENSADEDALAAQYGAQVCLKKPISPSQLLDSILAVERELKTPAAFVGQQPLATHAAGDCVLRICLFLGMSVRLTGYAYVRESVDFLSRDSLPHPIRGADIFALIAQRRGTTPSSVERLIRYALSTTWKRGCVERANLLLGEDLFSPAAPPSSVSFIKLLARQASDMRHFAAKLRMSD